MDLLVCEVVVFSVKGGCEVYESSESIILGSAEGLGKGKVGNIYMEFVHCWYVLPTVCVDWW